MNKKVLPQSIRSVKHLRGKRIFFRVDVNVPLLSGKVADDTRLRAILPTLTWLQKKGAIIFIISHLGRPEGRAVPSLSLRPVAIHLEMLLGKPVNFLNTKDWSKENFDSAVTEEDVQSAKPGDIFLAENIRFSKEEEKGEINFAKRIAKLADVYVTDAFAAVHRKDVSVAKVPLYLPAYAGFLLEKEIVGLETLNQSTAAPYVALVGGIKLETKIPLIKKLLREADGVLLGGGIVNTCLVALGYSVGTSLYDKNFVSVAKTIARHKKVFLPIDLIVGDKKGDRVRHIDVPMEPTRLCSKNEAIFDIGPKTIAAYSTLLKDAKRVVWNGAMGYFEMPVYAQGTRMIARTIGLLRKKRTYTVVGGGETAQALEQVGHANDVRLLSTGGGAMLSYIAGEKLPGIEVLQKRKKETNK